MSAFLFFVVLLVLLSTASFLGLTKDSRDNADWAPTGNGHRVARRL